MRLFAVLLFQAGVPIMPSTFDLATLPAPACGAGAAGDIVVCARHAPAAPASIARDTPPEGMPRAELRLFGNVRGSLHGEQASVGGFTSNRAMVTLTLPF